MNSIENFRNSANVLADSSANFFTSKVNTVEKRIHALFEKCSTLCKFCTEACVSNTSVVLEKISGHYNDCKSNLVGSLSAGAATISTLFKLLHDVCELNKVK